MLGILLLVLLVVVSDGLRIFATEPFVLGLLAGLPLSLLTGGLWYREHSHY